MNNIEIVTQSGLTLAFCVKIRRGMRLDKYLWKSTKTDKIYLVNNLIDATKFKSRNEALIVAEEYLTQK